MDGKVKVYKLTPSASAATPTAAWSQWVAGGENPGLSPPAEYTVTGILMRPIAEGERLHLDRDSRNGAPATGEFSTSPIRAIVRDGERLLVETLNSVYVVESL